MCFDLDGFAVVDLQQTRGRKESDLYVRDIEGGDLDHAQVPFRVVDGPCDLALSFYLEPSGDTFEASDRARRSKSAIEIFWVRRNGNAGARVPDDWACVGHWSQGVAHTCWCLECHSECGGARKMDVCCKSLGNIALAPGPGFGTCWKTRACGRDWTICRRARGLSRNRVASPIVLSSSLLDRSCREGLRFLASEAQSVSLKGKDANMKLAKEAKPFLLVKRWSLLAHVLTLAKAKGVGAM
jgi:hypothetical protein